MKFKHLLTLALAVAFVIVAPVTAKADTVKLGWNENSTGWWYQVDETTYYKDTIQCIDGKYYYFDEKGYMAEGWVYDSWESDDGEVYGNWYYANDKGELQTGWQKIKGTWYYLSTDGFWMYENGTYTINDKMYHFAPNGAMTTGWYLHEYEGGGTDWFYSNDKGEVQTGWQKIKGEWYYLSEYGGYMYSDGRYYIDEEYYFFKPTGQMVSGWYNYGGASSTYGDWVLCDSDGVAYDGWFLSGNGSYYYIQNGYMAQNAYVCTDKDEDGTTRKYTSGGAYGNHSNYYVGRDGKMITGWYDVSTFNATGYRNVAWKYASADGSIKAQWVKSGSDWYFVDRDGDMVRNGVYMCVKDGVERPYYDDYDTWEEYEAACLKFYYVFDENGKMVNGGEFTSTSSSGTAHYYAEADGHAKDGWVEKNGNWYYYSYGQRAENTVVDGKYYVNADGVWVK